MKGLFKQKVEAVDALEATSADRDHQETIPCFQH
jgi:hypothetical protein